MVSGQWKRHVFPIEKVVFPPIVSFGNDMEVTVKHWESALLFIISGEKRNYNFWTCVRRALQELKTK
jgi:hypothetical protein